jgi:flagellar motor switch protein FliM
MPEGQPLSQSEVDALLAAISAGEVELEAKEAPPIKRIVPYDFRRPERVARDQLRAIANLHEVFARNLQVVLSGMLRSVIDLKIAHTEQLTYSEFINSLPNPTNFNVISCEPLEGNFILEINPSIAFPIFERLMGSSRTSSTIPERALTEIEQKLLQSILDKIISLLKELWAPFKQIDFRVTAKESNPQLMPIMGSNEPVVAVGVEAIFGEHKGLLNICIPVVSIEGMIDKIAAHTWFTRRKSEASPGYERSISESLSSAEVNLVAYMAETTISLEDLLNLSPGDIILSEHGINEPIVICVEGRPKFLGTPGNFKDHKAVKITQQIKEAQKISSF